MKRRRFLQAIGVASGATLARRVSAAETRHSPAAEPMRYEEWLAARHRIALTARHVETFLNAPGRFDSELGYLPIDSVRRDGIDGSSSVYRYEATRERKRINYPDRPCRMHTYGNSFTHGAQVSDGETWQEYLAAHFGEPIRNFGVSGYGVFQAFARLRRVEQADVNAPYLVFNIFDDDHQRSIMPWRGFIVNYGLAGRMRSNPWTYLRVNLDSGRWEERPNPCPSPASVRELVSFERARELTAGHEIVQLRAMMEGVPDVPRDRIRRLAEWANLKFDFDDADARRESAVRLNEIVARSSTYFVMENMLSFAARQERRLLVAFSFGGARIRLACAGKPRDPADRTLVDWLRERDVPCFDVRDAHLADFAVFRLSPEDYVNRYFNGHYNQRGNQFFALALKDSLIQWLDPKPPAYRPGGPVIDPRGDI